MHHHDAESRDPNPRFEKKAQIEMGGHSRSCSYVSFKEKKKIKEFAADCSTYVGGRQHPSISST
jgi:hypothetical protein